MRHAITQRQQLGISREFKRVAIPALLSVYPQELGAYGLDLAAILRSEQNR